MIFVQLQLSIFVTLICAPEDACGGIVKMTQALFRTFDLACVHINNSLLFIVWLYLKASSGIGS